MSYIARELVEKDPEKDLKMAILAIFRDTPAQWPTQKSEKQVFGLTTGWSRKSMSGSITEPSLSFQIGLAAENFYCDSVWADLAGGWVGWVGGVGRIIDFQLPPHTPLRI
jgi:hypothetical protein